MKTYLVNVKVDIPYPKEFSYQIPASGFRTAIGRAITQMRNDLGRKKIEAVRINAQVLQGIQN